MHIALNQLTEPIISSDSDFEGEKICLFGNILRIRSHSINPICDLNYWSANRANPGICSAGRMFLHSKKKHMNPAPIL